MKISARKFDLTDNEVLPRIFLGNDDRLRVVIEGLNRSVTQLGRGDGKDSRAGADIEQ